MENNARYTRDPKMSYDFMDNFSVACPKCQKKAEVTVPSFLDYKNAILKCHSCHFSEKRQDRVRYLLAGKAKCAYCLDWLNLDMVGKKEIPNYVDIKCATCNQINEIRENWTEIIQKYSEKGIIDPAFGLMLWYCDLVKGEIIWAYNYNHLKEIKWYVSSKLRERSTHKSKMTMVEKLPDFIKMAKNRTEVLKAIERMENKKESFKF